MLTIKQLYLLICLWDLIGGTMVGESGSASLARLRGIDYDQHVKRNKDMHSLLQAVVHYTCPEAGMQIRTFRWGAYYTASDHTVVLKGFKNIDGFGPLVVVQQDFGALWHHRACIYNGYSCCSYTFLAQTTGHLYANAITLQVTTGADEHHRSLGPQITEWCKNFHSDNPHAQQVCPASNEQAAECTVTHIDVSIPA